MKMSPTQMRRVMGYGRGDPLPLDYQSREEQKRERDDQRRRRREGERRGRESERRGRESERRRGGNVWRVGAMDPFDWMIIMIVGMVILNCLGLMFKK